MTIVYTREGCSACDRTKRLMTQVGIKFEEYDLTNDPEAVEDLKQRGFKQLPVVESELAPWSGFQPDFIRQLKEYLSND